MPIYEVLIIDGIDGEIGENKLMEILEANQEEGIINEDTLVAKNIISGQLVENLILDEIIQVELINDDIIEV